MNVEGGKLNVEEASVLTLCTGIAFGFRILHTYILNSSSTRDEDMDGGEQQAAPS